jgi:hypothetical protein
MTILIMTLLIITILIGLNTGEGDIAFNDITYNLFYL